MPKVQSLTERAPVTARQRALRIALYFSSLLLFAFYFVQSSRIGTNHTDGGLIFIYIDDIARGLRPHFDFIDAYGPLNWPIPVLFYKLAGGAEWGVRVWVLLLKLLITALSYVFVRRLAGTLYAVLAAVWVALIYGQAWQSLQAAYAFSNVVPAVIAVWYLLLAKPFRRPATNFVIAGVLTGVAIWIKINSGLFVFAGGLFYLFYWLPPAAGAEPTAWDRRWQPAFRILRAAGLWAYAGVFYLYLRLHFDIWYFSYMLGPLALGLLWTWRSTYLERRTDVFVSHHLRAWGTYFGACLTCSIIVLLWVTRVTEALTYVREQADIFVPLTYDMPFPAIGVPHEFIGFNENFWPQLPLLLPLVFLAWIMMQHGRREIRAFGTQWQEAEAQAVGLYMMATLYVFVIYSRADETHIFQPLFAVSLAVLVLLRQIEAMCQRSCDRRSLTLRAALTVTLLAWGSTLFVVPGFAVFDLSTGERKHPKLKYLHYRERNNPSVRDFSPDITDHEWDQAMDAAAQYVDSRTEDGEPVLMLDANRLFHILSNTRPVGGRYHFYFYMVASELFLRPAFDRSVPAWVLRNILDHPPRVVVGTYGRVPAVAQAFPEIEQLVNERYRVTRNFRHILIFERNDIPDLAVTP
jgi:hypothetical protein